MELLTVPRVIHNSQYDIYIFFSVWSYFWNTSKFEVVTLCTVVLCPFPFGLLPCAWPRDTRQKKTPMSSGQPNSKRCCLRHLFFCWSSYRSWSHRRKESLPPKKKAAKRMRNNFNYKHSKTDLFPNFEKKKKNRHSQLHLSDFSVRSLATSAFDGSHRGFRGIETSMAVPMCFYSGRFDGGIYHWLRLLGIQSTNRWWLFCLDFCWETQRSCIHSGIMVLFYRHTWHLCVYVISTKCGNMSKTLVALSPWNYDFNNSQKTSEMILSSQKIIQICLFLTHNSPKHFAPPGFCLYHPAVGHSPPATGIPSLQP